MSDRIEREEPNQHSIWVCPHCGEHLAREDRHWHCSNGHCFDISREGYINLMPVNRKKSSSPGDNKEMVKNRRAFLSEGFYQPLADKLSSLLLSLGCDHSVCLDCGCGEGYYLSEIKHSLPGVTATGIDISKEAVRLASKRLPEAEFSVASGFDLPVGDSLVDVVIQIFAPSCEKEVHRVLKSSGYYIVVSPAENHLYQLRKSIYQEAKPHVIPPYMAGFDIVEEEKLGFEFTVNTSAGIEQLLLMTPYHWVGDQSAKNTLIASGQLTVSADFLIRVYRSVNNGIED